MSILVGALFFTLLVLWLKVWKMDHELSAIKSLLARKSESQQPVACSFCGKDKSAVTMLVSSEKALICNECVASCNEIIKAQHEAGLQNTQSTQAP